MANVQDLKTEEGWREEASKLVMEQAPALSGSLSSLARSSRIDQSELIQAAQQEEQDQAAGVKHKRKHHLRGRMHSHPKIDSAAVAGKILEEGGFQVFAARMEALFKEYQIDRPELVVEYRDVSVTTDALTGSASVATVGNTLPRAIKDVTGFGNETVELHVLKQLKGRLDPGRFTLLLGPPGSGKSTFLRVISGRLKTAKNLKVGGSLLYNGKEQSEFVVERTAAYVDQYDKHIPVFTVGETLSFAHTCAVGHDFEEFWKEAVRNHTAAPGAAAPGSAIGRAAPGSAVAANGVGAGGSNPGASPVSAASVSGDSGLEMDANGFVQPAEAAQIADLDELAATMAAGSKRQLKVEILLRLMGLVHTRNTIVGNALLRGVSGGERKRVTSCEMLVGRQRLLAMDEISTGLDSATLFSIVSFLKQACYSFRHTTVISLLQPPPEVFNLFDDLILMSEGSIVYHGPVNAVQAFFEDQGFVLPERMDLPSWLQEVTIASGQWKYATDALKRRAAPKPKAAAGPAPITAAPAPINDTAAGISKGPVAEATEAAPAASAAAAAATPGAASAFASAAAVDEGPVPQPEYDPETGRLPWLVSIEQMVAYYWSNTDSGRNMAQQLDTAPFDPATGHPKALVKSRYALTPMECIAVAFRRQWLLFIRNKALVTFRFVQIILIGLIIGSMFARLEPGLDTVRLFFGASFLSLLFIAFGSAPELSLVLQNRAVWYKYRDNYLLPAYAEAIAMACVRSLNTAWETLIFGTLVYWMVGYTASAGAFFTYLLLNFLIGLCMSALFRFIGSAVPTQTHAQAYGAMGILILVLTSGFAITRNAIPPWYIWAYYISPFAYCLRGIVINEMTQERWQQPSPTGQSIGDAGLESFGFFTDRSWIWAGVGYLIFFYLLMNTLTWLALKHYSGAQKRASVPDDRALARARMEADERRAKHAQQMASQATAASSIGRQSSLLGRRRSSTELAVVESHASVAKSHASVALTVGPNFGGGGAHQLPFEPVTLVFKDLRYFVPNPSLAAEKAKAKQAGKEGKALAEAADVPKELELLKGITGYAQPGVLMALMGGSGAGKTTLMDVIAGRKTVGRITGDILVNGHPKDQKTWSRVMGYVEQMDIHTPATTVLEALLFSAALRLPDTLSKSEVRTYVDEVVDIVDLLEIQNNLVGVPGESGLSTEQRKRLTIAVEMVANPAVIFMDEPTSGLDARAASIVMAAVKNIALNNRTVFVTIHQPSINIFESFDFLLLLQRGGRITYFGPLGHHSKHLIHYLESVPGTHPIDPGYNPATWMLEVTGGSMATIAAANNVDWPQLYLESELYAATVSKADKLVQQGTKDPLQVSGNHHGYAQPFFTQLAECTKKLTLAYWRNPSYNFMRLLLTLGCALIYGSLYYKVGTITANPATVANVQNVIGVLFSSTSFLGNINLMSVMPVFNTERVVFYRERASRMYDPFATGLATAAAEAPYLMMQTVIFVPIVYFMVGFEVDAGKFWYYFLMAFLSVNMYTTFGIFLVAATPALEVATLFSSALNFMFNIFNGFTITYEQMPSGWQWANRIVPTTWVLYGLGVSQLGGNETPLVTIGSTQPTTTVSGYLESNFGYVQSMQFWCLLILLAFIVFFRVGGILFLRYVNFLRR